MAGLSYVGATPVVANDIDNRLNLTAQLAAVTPNQQTVGAQINNLIGGTSPTYATKSYVDQLNATFTLPSYYLAQDQLNVPLASVGLASSTPLGTTLYYGVGSLDSSGKVPINQIPVVGAGYMKGFWGPTATASGTTGATPLKIADWQIGVAGMQFRPWVFLSAFVTCIAGARPVIEVRIANTNVTPTYAGSTLVAQGTGRSFYNDYHAIAVLPAPTAAGETPALLPTNYNVWATAWLYDLNSGANSVTIGTGGIASGALGLWRGAL